MTDIKNLFKPIQGIQITLFLFCLKFKNIIKTNNLYKDFLILGFVKGAEVNIDTKRNELITAIETALESDITRSSNALDTEVISVETDEGTLFPIGGIRMTIRCTYEFQAGTP